MNHTRLDSSIPLDKKITTDSVLYPTLKPMSSWSAFLSPHPHPSRMYARNGFQKSITIVLVFPASSLVRKLI